MASSLRPSQQAIKTVAEPVQCALPVEATAVVAPAIAPQENDDGASGQVNGTTHAPHNVSTETARLRTDESTSNSQVHDGKTSEPHVDAPQSHGCQQVQSISKPKLDDQEELVNGKDWLRFPQVNMAGKACDLEEEDVSPSSGFDMEAVEQYTSDYVSASRDEVQVSQEDMNRYQELRNGVFNTTGLLNKITKDRMAMFCILDEMRESKERPEAINESKKRLARLEVRQKSLEGELAHAKSELRRCAENMLKRIEYALQRDFDFASVLATNKKAYSERKALVDDENELIQMAQLMGVPPKPEPFQLQTNDDKQKSSESGSDSEGLYARNQTNGNHQRTPPRPLGVANRSHECLGGDCPLGLLKQQPNPAIEDACSPPDWFKILEKKGKVKLHANGQKARYQELVSMLSTASWMMNREEEDMDNGAAPKKQWTKEWHEPNKFWPYKKWQERGGFWTCRSGPEASVAERRCTVCKSKRPTPQAKQSTSSTPSTYKSLMNEIDDAMKVAHEQEAKNLRARISSVYSPPPCRGSSSDETCRFSGNEAIYMAAPAGGFQRIRNQAKAGRY